MSGESGYNNREGMLQYLTAEKEEMERHKWIESEKAGRDLGDSVIIDWIKKHASDFRYYYYHH